MYFSFCIKKNRYSFEYEQGSWKYIKDLQFRFETLRNFNIAIPLLGINIVYLYTNY